MSLLAIAKEVAVEKEPETSWSPAWIVSIKRMWQLGGCLMSWFASHRSWRRLVRVPFLFYTIAEFLQWGRPRLYLWVIAKYFRIDSWICMWIIGGDLLPSLPRAGRRAIHWTIQPQAFQYDNSDREQGLHITRAMYIPPLKWTVTGRPYYAISGCSKNCNCIRQKRSSCQTKWIWGQWGYFVCLKI